MRGSGLTKGEALETLRFVAGLETPLWLSGGIGADFHTGRWTREHDDIDLLTFEDHRARLESELSDAGWVKTHDDGWVTRWSAKGRATGEVAVAYLRRVDETTGDLVVGPDGTRGGNTVPGVYDGLPGNLDAERFRSLEDVRIRVVSAEDEWAFTKCFSLLHPGAKPDATDDHNVALLEAVIAPEELDRLRELVGRRLRSEEIDVQS